VNFRKKCKEKFTYVWGGVASLAFGRATRAKALQPKVARRATVFGVWLLQL